MSEDNKEKTRVSKRLYPSLATWEISIWTASWLFGVGYSIYHVYKASRHFRHVLPLSDFEPGFLLKSHRKDVSDAEWTVFAPAMLKFLPWMFLHLLGSQYFKKFHKEALPLFNVVLSAVFFCRTVGHLPFAFLLIQPCIMFIIGQFGSPALVWMASLLILVSVDTKPVEAAKSYIFTDASWMDRYMTHVVMFWINSRCVSFCVDHIWNEVPAATSKVQQFVNMLAYCFYLPVAIQGPLIMYKEFHEGMTSEYEPWNLKRCALTGLSLARYLFWFLFIEVTLNFFYFSSLKFEHVVLQHVDLWTLCGIGFSMGEFFYMKYVFFYGLSRPFVQSDGIDAPNHPKCIARIHLYSDMWRYFDVGLHRFLHKYIYGPIMGSKKPLWKQLLAATLCFTFVYVWHGVMPHILVWSILNYVGILAETVARAINKTKTYQDIETSLLSPRGKRRFYALLSAPLFMMSILSNFYFLMGADAGWIFVSKTVTSWPIGTPVILFFMYCGAQTSIEVKNWETRQKLLAPSKHKET